MINNLPSSRKIDIKIKEDFKYANVAFLVDRDDFLTDITDIRASLNIIELIPYEDIKKWKYSGTKEGSLRTMDEEGKHAFNRTFKLSNSVYGLKEKYHRGINYTNVIESAIIAGEVREEDYNRTAFCVDYPFSKEFYDQEFNIEEPMVAIFVNQETQVNEVTKLLNNEVKELFKSISNREQKIPRTSTNIKRDRVWYWKHIDGLSYQKILNETPESIAVVGRQAVIDAIKQYKLNLGIRRLTIS